MNGDINAIEYLRFFNSCRAEIIEENNTSY